MQKVEKEFIQFVKVVQVLHGADQPLTKKHIAGRAGLGTTTVHQHLMRLTRSRWARASLPKGVRGSEYRYMLTESGSNRAEKLLATHTSPDRLAQTRSQ